MIGLEACKRVCRASTVNNWRFHPTINFYTHPEHPTLLALLVLLRKKFFTHTHTDAPFSRWNYQLLLYHGWRPCNCASPWLHKLVKRWIEYFQCVYFLADIHYPFLLPASNETVQPFVFKSHTMLQTASKGMLTALGVGAVFIQQ